METVPRTLPEVIRNDEKLYQGNLIHYYQVLFRFAQNLELPYHNFRHMFHVMWACAEACRFYRDVLTKRQMRNMLVAALFHDFDHSGMLGNDDLNIERAIRGLRKHIAPVDLPYIDEVVQLMRATEYPYKTAMDQLDLCAAILRDADASQALTSAWIQQVIFGLSAEWRVKPIEVLAKQEPFLKNLSFHTDWGKKRFPQSDIDAKIQETRELLALLETNPNK